jgi:hypothetical protein
MTPRSHLLKTLLLLKKALLERLVGVPCGAQTYCASAITYFRVLEPMIGRFGKADLGGRSAQNDYSGRWLFL